MQKMDSEKSTEELLEEYSRIVTHTAQSAECAHRVQAIMFEIRKRGAAGKPAARRMRSSKARKPR
jgi:hypothetical protein